MQVTTVGLDLAKRIFQVHGVDAAVSDQRSPPSSPIFRPAWWGSKHALPHIIGPG